MSRRLLALATLVIALLATYRAAAPAARAADCRRTTMGLTPLNELGTKPYQGFAGGLYGGGENTPPAAHQALAMARTALIEPLGPDGRPATDGRIGLLSIGMSNTTLEFSRFAEMAGRDGQIHPAVTVVDGAQGGQDAATIRDPAAAYWQVVEERLAQAGITAAQVQAIWLKEAHSRPSGPFPTSAQALTNDLETIVGILAQRYPNVRVVYLSSRIYAGYASTALNPEPYAYESGFAVQWLIGKQIQGDAALNADPARGTVRAPVLLWGPYLWADGLNRRADGLIWRCEDFEADGTHPGPVGRQKVANLLMAFFKTDPTARRWFMSDPQATPLPLPTIYQPGTSTPRPTRTGGRPTPGPQPTMSPATPRSYRVKETPSGDQMWITTSVARLQRQIERLTPGTAVWLCGQVIADPNVEWGFRFAEDRLAIVAITLPNLQTTIRQIAANPAAAHDRYLCIQIEIATEWVEGTPPATGTPGTPLPTLMAPTMPPTPGPGTPTATRSSPFPTRPVRPTPTGGSPRPTRDGPRRTPATPEPTPTESPEGLYLPLLLRNA